MQPAEFLQQVEADQLKAIKAEKARIGVLVFLCIFVFGYLSVLKWYITSKFDAQQLTDQLATMAESTIVNQQKPLGERLASYAPQAASQLMERIKSMPGEARLFLEKKLNENNEHLMGIFETELNKHVDQITEQMLWEFKAEKYGDGTVEDKMELIMHHMMKQYKEMCFDALDRMDSELRLENTKLISYLDKLATGAALSPEEKIHKEIIESTLALLKKHLQGHERSELTLLSGSPLIPAHAFNVFTSNQEPEPQKLDQEGVALPPPLDVKLQKP